LLFADAWQIIVRKKKLRISYMRNFIKDHRFLAGLLSIFISVFLVSIVTYAATTIGTNIETAGTATMESASTTNDFWLGNVIADDDDYLYFDASGTEYLMWDNDPGDFVISDNFQSVTTTDSLAVGGYASSTGNINTQGNLHVGGDASVDGTFTVGSSTNSTITSLSFGTCNIAATSVTASSTAFAECAAANGVIAGDNVFVTATSSLPTNYSIKAASSTIVNEISLEIMNHGYVEDPADNTGARSFFWQAIR